MNVATSHLADPKAFDFAGLEARRAAAGEEAADDDLQESVELEPRELPLLFMPRPALAMEGEG